LDDLPAVESGQTTSCHGLKFWVKRPTHVGFGS